MSEARAPGVGQTVLSALSVHVTDATPHGRTQGENHHPHPDPRDGTRPSRSEPLGTPPPTGAPEVALAASPAEVKRAGTQTSTPPWWKVVPTGPWDRGCPSQSTQCEVRQSQPCLVAGGPQSAPSSSGCSQTPALSETPAGNPSFPVPTPGSESPEPWGEPEMPRQGVWGPWGTYRRLRSWLPYPRPRLSSPESLAALRRAGGSWQFPGL